MILSANFKDGSKTSFSKLVFFIKIGRSLSQYVVLSDKLISPPSPEKTFTRRLFILR
jgi:hypothetical protein